MNISCGANSLAAKKMRVELFDTEGNRYTVAFEGQITRDKALRLLDLIELLGGMPNETMNRDAAAPSLTQPSRLEKVRTVVQRSFPLVWFSSRDIQTVYEQEMKEPINLSTVSTYLSRMAGKGFLMRAGDGNSLRYKTVSKIPQAPMRPKTT